MADQGKSVTWIVVAAAVFVVVAGWGFLAGSYAGSRSGSLTELSDEEAEAFESRGVSQARRGAVGTFVGHSIEQLPNMPTVISWHFSNRIWLPILIALALAGVIGGGFGLKAVERNLNQPRHRKRK